MSEPVTLHCQGHVDRTQTAVQADGHPHLAVIMNKALTFQLLLWDSICDSLLHLTFAALCLDKANIFILDEIGV